MRCVCRQKEAGWWHVLLNRKSAIECLWKHAVDCTLWGAIASEEVGDHLLSYRKVLSVAYRLPPSMRAGQVTYQGVPDCLLKSNGLCDAPAGMH